MKEELKKLKRQRVSLLEAISDYQDALQGSLIRIYRMCHNKECPCRGKRRNIHGASYYISTKEAGKTHLLYVPKEKLQEARERIAQFKKLKSLIGKLTRLNKEIFRLSKGANYVRKIK